jgi:serine/threonine protein kinase
MLICEVCGKVNPEGSRNCDYCGAHLGSAQPLPPDSAPLLLAAAQDAALSGPVCPKCRRGNRRGAAFCTHCGYDLTQSAQPQLSKPTGDGGPSRKPSQPLNYDLGSVAANVTGNLPPGMVLKRRYRILRKIAQGGMGAVYESTDIEAPAGSRWAVKEISPAALPPEERRQAISDFRREAQILATLQHPNLPTVLETFEEMGKHFLVMEFVPGRTLLNVVDATHSFIHEDRIMVWARQLFDVLHYLHSQDPPIIYRDLKPANIMLVEGTERIKLIDFGIARFHKAGKSHDTEAFGTAGYAPPEQYGKGQTDQRSDIYALGATLHHLLTRHDPSLSPFNWLPVRRYNRALPIDLENAIARAVSLDAGKRFASMAEFAEAMGIRLHGEQQAPAPKPTEAITATAPTSPQARPTPDGLLQPNGPSEPPKPAPRKAEPSPPKPATPPRIPASPFTITPAPIVAAPPPSPQPVAPPMQTAAQAATVEAPTKPQALPKPDKSAPTLQDIVQGTQSVLAALAEIAPQIKEPLKKEAPKAEQETHEIVSPQPDTRRAVAPNQQSAIVNPKFEEPVLDLGEVRWNSRPARKLALRSAAGGQMKGTVVATQPWIAYNPHQFNGNPVTLEVKVKHRELPFGRTELHVPNLFAIIWARTRRVLPFIGFWFWVVVLAVSALGKILPWALVGAVAGLVLLELLIWIWTLHVRYLVPSEKLNTGRLMVKSSEGDRQIEVRVVARPSWMRKAAGWTGAMLLLLAEVAAITWIALTIAGITLPLPGL